MTLPEISQNDLTNVFPFISERLRDPIVFGSKLYMEREKQRHISPLVDVKGADKADPVSLFEASK